MLNIDLILRKNLSRKLTHTELDSNFTKLKQAITDQSGSIGNGYAIFPNGFIFQWGYGGTITGVDEQVNFPISFKSKCFGVWIDEIYAAGWTDQHPGTMNATPTIYGQKELTKTYFKMNGCIQRANQNYYQGVPGIGYMWLAIGK